MQGRIVFATGNAGKIKEIRMIMEDTGLEVVSMKDAGIKADIEENGKTYEESPDQGPCGGCFYERYRDGG